MRSLHVLLIAESFPPSAYVGSIRPGAVVRALIRAGHRATVIRSAAYAAAGRPPMDGEGIRVLTVTARENPIRILARLNPFRGGGRATAGAPGNRSVDARETILGRVRRWVLSLGLLPDDSQGFIPAAVLAALDHHRGDRFDLLMTTAPPFSDHLIGVLLSRLLGVPWVAEFRDPWLPRSSQAPARSAVVDWLEQRLEDQVLRQCDLIVAVTPSAGLALDRKRLALGKPGGTLVAMNGIPALLPESPRPTDGPLEVLHAGVLYLGRDPRPFLRAVAAGVRAGRFGPAGVRIRFMGSSGGEFEGQSVAQMADALGIGDCVEILGQRPIEECRKMMAQADALLLLAQAQPTQIPNKLYDYVATRRPIIGYVDAQGESAVLLHGVGGHHLVCDSDPGHDEAVVEALLASRQAAAGAGMDSNQLSSLLTEVQLAPLVESLERLAAPADSARGFRVPPARPISAAAAGAARHPRPDSVVSGAADASVAVNLAVSVVIPAWNVAEHIGEAVRSVLAQTFRNWELIVINDGSPDTAALERALAPYRDRLTYLVQENRGPGEARNTGLAAARGTWIAFLDGDDVWLPGYLHHQLSVLESVELDMVYANAALIDGPRRRGRTFMELAPSRGVVSAEALLAARCNVITSGTVIRREVLMSVGAFPNRRAHAEDFNTWLRVALSGARIGYQRTVLLRHRIRLDGLTGDSVSSAQRAIQALVDAAEMPLGRRERQARERSLARMHRRLRVEQVKGMVLSGEYAEARRQLQAVVARHPRPKWLAALLVLYLRPGLVRRRLLGQGASENDGDHAAEPGPRQVVR